MAIIYLLFKILVTPKNNGWQPLYQIHYNLLIMLNIST